MPSRRNRIVALVLVAAIALIINVAGVTANRLHYTPSGMIIVEGPDLQPFASRDGRTQWEQIEPLPGGARYGIFTGPRAGVWYAGYGGLYWSPEDRWSWQPVLSVPVAWVTWSPSGDHCLFKVWGDGIYLAGEGGLFPRVDGNSHYRLGLPTARPVQSGVITDDGKVFISLFDLGVYVSSDRGETWEAVDTGLLTRQVLNLVQSPQGQIYAATFGAGLWVWESGQNAWRQVDDDLADTIITAVSFDESGAMIVGTQEQGLYVFDVDGRNGQWDPGIARTQITGAMQTPNGARWVYQPESGLFTQGSGATGWSLRPFRFTNRVQQVAVDSEERWFVNIAGVGLAVSDNEGDSWRLLDLPSPWHEDNEFSISEKGTLFLSSGSEVWRQDADGSDWSMDDAVSRDVPVVSLQRSPEGIIYLALNERGGLFYLDDNERWTSIGAQGSHSHSYWIHHLGFYPGQTVAFGAYDTLVESKDGWIHTHFGQSGRDVFQTPQGDLATERMLSYLVYDPLAERWLSTDAVPVSERFQTIYRVADGEYIGFGQSAGFARWETPDEVHRPQALDGTVVLDLSIIDDNRLLAGTTQGLWLSSDRGRSWARVPLRF